MGEWTAQVAHKEKMRRCQEARKETRVWSWEGGTMGQNQVILSHQIIHFPTSERCERTGKGMSKWPSFSVCIVGCFQSRRCPIE